MMTLLVTAVDSIKTVNVAAVNTFSTIEKELNMLNNLQTWLIKIGVSEMYAGTLKLMIVFGIIIFLAIIADWVAKRIFLAVVAQVAKKTETVLDDILVENKVFHRLANLAPAIVIFYAIKIPLANNPLLLSFLHTACELYLIIMGLMVILAFIKSLSDMYLTLPISKTRSIKGYIQVVKIILYIVVTLVIISVIWSLDIGKLFTGLGAMTAVLMFVFKDTIMGLVASIQLSANDMLRPGDWIEMPSKKADGIVTDISLTTVKVQNFDKTITTIPTNTLVSDSFTNWRGMEESGGRRIKRFIYIDMNSVHFLSDDAIKNLAGNKIVAKNFNVNEYLNDNSNYLSGQDSNHRTETNLGLFRSYMELYLSKLPVVNPEMTLLVRYQQSAENGMPLEILVFTKEKAGRPYEKVQSEIFDHVLAMLPIFELKAYQRPSN